MNYHSPTNSDALPDADYRGRWTDQVLEDRRPTDAEDLDRKCSEMSDLNRMSK